MTLLAIDTTGPDCAVALRVDGRPDRVLCERINRGHAERLAPMVEQILADAGVTPGALTRIGVTIGPGSLPAPGSARPSPAVLPWRRGPWPSASAISP